MLVDHHLGVDGPHEPAHGVHKVGAAGDGREWEAAGSEPSQLLAHRDVLLARPDHDAGVGEVLRLPATAATTNGAALPTCVAAIPARRSMNELPPTSWTAPPPARSTCTGRLEETPAATLAARRAASASDLGPGIGVTSCRCCGRSAGIKEVSANSWVTR